MATLCVNIDHVATLRQARGGPEPDPVLAAMLVEQAGSSGVTLHLREDRRHVQDRDARLIRQVVQGHMNLEMAATDAMLEVALAIKPHVATLVPERRQELTTEGGLDVVGGGQSLRRAIARLREAGVTVSLFIDAEAEQIEAALQAGADEIELHTGPYAHARDRHDRRRHLDRLRQAGELARRRGLGLNAGHGLNYHNVGPVAAIEGMDELNIGHAIVSRAVFDGLGRAVAEMAALIRDASA